MTSFSPGERVRPRNEYPVREVASARLRVTTERGAGTLPVYRSADEALDARVRRVVIVLHGRLRDADAYLLSAERALAAADVDATDTLLIVPQFLASADIAAHDLDQDTLHWDWTGWMGGDDAVGPAPISSFEVLDSLVEEVSDRSRFASLREVVIAGHSGGAQVAHRYAVVGRAAALLAEQGVHCRYVIANPSSYVYFDKLRPDGNGGFSPADESTCTGVDTWKYGIHQPPRYASGDASFDVLEQRYARSDVIYLLGEADCDPQHQALDRSCAANAQGPHRLARGLAYFEYLRRRHPRLAHRCWQVPGVGHNGQGMFNSADGLLALFDAKARAYGLGAGEGSELPPGDGAAE
jgi:pimeloyl-ACP methyl ester carboxylesterase